MFILHLKYLKPISEVERVLPKHNPFLDKYYANNKFICSGRKVPRDGGIILCRAKDIDEVKEIISEDPFYIEQVADYEITEFNPTKYTQGFDNFL
jgi:uncharacterized protein YciI